MSLSKNIEQFRDLISQMNICVPEVSKWSVGMHLHHCALAMKGVTGIIIKSSKPVPEQKFNILRTIVFFTGRIPRGRAKAPDISAPSENVTPEELHMLLDECEQAVQEAGKARGDAWFEHFIFGVLKRDKSLRFLEIHNNHHQRIIDQILQSASPV